MEMGIPEDLCLSAKALRMYLDCPLRFRYRYVDNLYWSRLWGSQPEERRALQQGWDFHLLARRYYAGVDPTLASRTAEGAELAEWFGRLVKQWPRTAEYRFFPELELRLTRPELRLVAKIDLLAVDPDGRATIYDWKTEQQMSEDRTLRTSLQTRVYRFLVCAAGGAYSPRGRFEPDEVSMIYWNPQFPDRWHRLPYSQDQYRQDAEYLQSLADHIRRTPEDGFEATPKEDVCRRCEYWALCPARTGDRAEMVEEEELLDETLSWDDLPELP